MLRGAQMLSSRSRTGSCSDGSSVWTKDVLSASKQQLPREMTGPTSARHSFMLEEISCVSVSMSGPSSLRGTIVAIENGPHLDVVVSVGPRSA